MEIRENLKYLESHEWVEISGNVARIGITDYAQNELGDIVFVELPAVGESVVADKEFANVESVKAVSPVNSPVSGKIIAVNGALEDAPEMINDDAFDAWFVEVEITALSDKLLDAAAYEKICK
ncbi:MAG: glycine cleavage system protein GcvH [Christensenellales bacterium]